MGFTTDQSFAVATLAIYTAVAVPTLFVLFKHGTRGLAVVGWAYVLVFCTLKMVGSGLQLGNSTDAGPSIISSIGLSPLLLATEGILQEA